MKFTCKCCGIDANFESEVDFFNADWERIAPIDATEITPAIDEQIFCNLCPSFYSSDIAYYDHSDVHDVWDTMGRPEKFTIGSCLRQDDKGRIEHIQSIGQDVLNSRHTELEKRIVSSTLYSIHYNDKGISGMLEDWSKMPEEPSIW